MTAEFLRRRIVLSLLFNVETVKVISTRTVNVSIPPAIEKVPVPLPFMDEIPISDRMASMLARFRKEFRESHRALGNNTSDRCPFRMKR